MPDCGLGPQSTGSFFITVYALARSSIGAPIMVRLFKPLNSIIARNFWPLDKSLSRITIAFDPDTHHSRLSRRHYRQGRQQNLQMPTIHNMLATSKLYTEK